MILCVALTAPACVGKGPYGYDAQAWLELLSSGDPLPIPADREPDIDRLAELGPGALLFLAMHAADRGLPELELSLLVAAAERETGRYRIRAAELLADRLDPDSQAEESLAFALSDAGGLVAPLKRASLQAEALMALGRWAEAYAAIQRYRATFPDQAADPRLAAKAALALISSRDPRWILEFRLLFSASANEPDPADMARVLAAYKLAVAEETRLEPIPSPHELTLAQARVYAGTRDYGAAVIEFRRLAAIGSAEAPASTPARLDASALAALVASLPGAYFSDLANAFLYGSRDEGAPGFKALADSALEPGLDDESAYLRLYWAGRFARAAESWKDAAAIFDEASLRAETAERRDAALWYRIDSVSRASIRDAAALLGQALGQTADPGYYSDLIEPISRSALLARDGMTLAILDAAVAAAGSPADQARLAYVCGRAASIGIIRKDHIDSAFGAGEPEYQTAESYARSRFAYAAGQNADPWYRAMASYRLAPDGLAETLAPVTPAAPATPATPIAPSADGAAAYALDLIRFGLASRLRTELGPELNLVPPDSLRAAAERLYASGDYPGTIRVMAALFRRPGFVPTRRDRELYWPRPYGSLFSGAAEETGIPEALLFGLARSESLFQDDVVSAAGAVGLTQLMPSTAEESAKRIKLGEYSLTDPDDNLRIGAAYLKRMLDTLDGGVLPALFSYNAGLSRYRAWSAAAGRLPFDLMLETLAYQETRQYGRNVVGAALMYAALYGGIELESFAGYLLGE